jgi:hypothetical protein
MTVIGGEGGLLTSNNGSSSTGDLIFRHVQKHKGEDTMTELIGSNNEAATGVEMETPENGGSGSSKIRKEFEAHCPMLKELGFADHYGPDWANKIEPLFREIKSLRTSFKEIGIEAGLAEAAAEAAANVELWASLGIEFD